MPVPGSGTDGRRDLPGEHGFRFFPGFYRHLPHTMRRIPFGGRRDGVFANLAAASRMQVARDGGVGARRAGALPQLAARPGPGLQVAVRLRDRPGDRSRRAAALRRPPAPAAHQLREAPLRRLRAPELVGVLRGGRALGGLPEVPRRRTHAHARGGEGARDERAHGRLHPAAAAVRPGQPGGQADRVLDGPTNDVWIDPWLAHLRGLGVDYRSSIRYRRSTAARGG